MAADMFKRYGIKEVCDVTFFKLVEKEGGAVELGKPVLYLDTLKVSTAELTAEDTSARGGKGNPKLVTWDYNKEITVTLEDALFSAKSMAMMFGDKEVADADGHDEKRVFRTVRSSAFSDALDKVKINGKEYTVPTEEKAVEYFDASGKPLEAKPEGKDKFAFAVIQFQAKADSFTSIEISSDTFPGTYKVIGDTYARSEATGEDSFFQLVINKAKVKSEVTLTMEAEGDPSTFSMSLDVMRPADGSPMIELIKYDLGDDTEAEVEDDWTFTVVAP